VTYLSQTRLNRLRLTVLLLFWQMRSGSILEHILGEIARTARDNGGAPLGRDRFFHETGIKDTDWQGRYWSRWGDAVREAGLAPNQLQEAYPRDVLLTRLAHLSRELGKIPVAAEMRIKRRSDPTFPNDKVFFNRFKTKGALVAALADFCRARPEFADVVSLCGTDAVQTTEAAIPTNKAEQLGFVYLLKSGRFYKIGRSNAVGRRERELAIQLPERSNVVHEIKTDDPPGIEDYWHRRFGDRRKNGEWFQLTPGDVAAFRRRKFM
jgi:hypothetical protein